MDLSAYNGFLYSLARKYAESEDVIDDLVQEGYLGLIEAAKRFKEEKEVKFLTYGGWWAGAYMKQYLRREATRERHIIRWGEPSASDEDHDFDPFYKIESPDPLPDDLCWRQEVITLLRKAMLALCQQDLDLLHAYFWENRTLYEIADELKITAEAVRQRIHKALDRLRRHLVNFGVKGYNRTKAKRRLRCQGER